MKPLISELQRRRVPRVVAFYMAAAFAVSQGVQLLQAALHFPEWVLTVTVIAALGGFPFVVLLAWFYDFGRDVGVVRTPNAPPAAFRWSLPYVSAAAITFAALMLGGWIALKPRPDDAGRVAVLPLQNRTSDASLDPLGEIAADWITELLVRAAFVDVVDLETALPAGIGSASTNGAALTANTLVSGSYYRDGDRLIFNVRITTAEGELIEALQPIQGPVTQPTLGLGDLRDRVVAALASNFDQHFARFEGGGAAPSYQAYQAYVDGLHAYLSRDFKESVPHFRRAVALDTTFLRALMWAAAASALAGDGEFADQAYEKLMTRSDQLSSYDRHHLLFFMANHEQDNERAYTEAHAMMKASPGSHDAVREAGLTAIRTGRIDEGIALFERLGKEGDVAGEWPEYYYHLAMAHELKGDLGKAMDVARVGRARHTTPHTLAAVGSIAAHQGNLPLALAMADTLAQQFPLEGYLFHIAMRLDGTGHHAEAIELWRRNAELTTDAPKRGLSSYYANESDVAVAISDSAVRANPTRGNRQRALVTSGLFAARRGDRVRAKAALDSLSAEDIVRTTWLSRARIYAALGEKDPAVRVLGRGSVITFATPTNLNSDFRSLVGYPPFERAMAPRR